MTKIDNWRNADGRTADQFSGLRAAIAAGPTDGPWIACGPSFGAEKPVYCEEVVVDRTGDEDDGHGICQAPTGLATESTVDMDYIAAANPATIRALLAERDSLAGEVERMTVTEGMALVPIEPTPQMLARSHWSGSGDVSVAEEWARREVWARMVAAATLGDEDPGELFAEQHAGDFGTVER